MDSRAFRPLARTLTWRLLGWALVCALAIGAAQSWLIYRNTQQRMVLELEQIAGTTVPLLSVLLWDIEPAAVQRQVELLQQRPDIRFVRLDVATGQHFVAGDPVSGASQGAGERRYIVPQPGNPDAGLATLTVQVDPNHLWWTIAHSVALAWVGFVLLTLLLASIVAWVLNSQIMVPLRQMARFAAQLTPDRLSEPMVLRRRSHAWRDELDLVTDGFEVLRREVQSHITRLDERVAERTEELERALAAIRELSMTDPLTGCLTRLAFNERAAQEVLRAHRYGSPLAVLFSDVDHFKAVNDAHGHLAGDAAIAHVGRVLRAQLREGIDWVARYGGEEFVLVLPETRLDAAWQTAERLRAAIAAAPCRHGDAQITLTLSFGLATLQPREALESLLQRADDLLYEAKTSGRNRIVMQALPAPQLGNQPPLQPPQPQPPLQ